MAGKTTIGWTATHHEDGSVTLGATWNPTVGCVQVTPGCDHCYARELHRRRYLAVTQNGAPLPAQYSKPFETIQLMPERLDWPLHQKRPMRIFVNSVSDLFHSDVPEDYIRQVFSVMTRAHWHTFQVLTKRAGRLRELGPKLDWPSNVWMGVSIELDSLTPRADALRAGAAKAAVRFLSLEPLLGPLPSLKLEHIDWVITGGESGPGARPMQDDWVRQIRDKCVAAGVPMFFKQRVINGRKDEAPLLDGVRWAQFPEPRRLEGTLRAEQPLLFG